MAQTKASITIDEHLADASDRELLDLIMARQVLINDALDALTEDLHEHHKAQNFIHNFLQQRLGGTLPLGYVKCKPEKKEA